jgi:hypothetical protein
MIKLIIYEFITNFVIDLEARQVNTLNNLL